MIKKKNSSFLLELWFVNYSCNEKYTIIIILMRFDLFRVQTVKHIFVELNNLITMKRDFNIIIFIIYERYKTYINQNIQIIKLL